MDSRELITGDDELHILVDTESIDGSLSMSGDYGEKILRYRQHDFFTFLRSPSNSSYDLLSDVEQYTIKKHLINRGTFFDGLISWVVFSTPMKN